MLVREWACKQSDPKQAGEGCCVDRHKRVHRRSDSGNKHVCMHWIPRTLLMMGTLRHVC
jgi:hypothetical protein